MIVVTRIQPLSELLQGYKIPQIGPQIMPRCMNATTAGDSTTTPPEVATPPHSLRETPGPSIEGPMIKTTLRKRKVDTSSKPEIPQALFPYNTTTHQVSATSPSNYKSDTRDLHTDKSTLETP